MTDPTIQELVRRFGPDIGIESIEPMRGGWEARLVKVTLRGQARAVVVREFLSASAAEKARIEAHALEILARSGYPVPELAVPHREGDSSLVIEFLDGAPLMPADRPTMPAEGDLLPFSELFVRLHALDPAPFVTLPGHGDPEGRLQRRLNHWRESYPSFAPAVDAVKGRLAGVRLLPSVTHGDFHPGNVVASTNGLVVIDWAGAAIADASEDLAWTMLLAGAHVGNEARVTIRDTYLELAPDREPDLAPFEAFAALARLADLYESVSDAGTGSAGPMLSALESFRWVHDHLEATAGARVPEIDRLLEDT